MVENTDVSRTQVMCHMICIFFDLLQVELVYMNHVTKFPSIRCIKHLFYGS